ncbi:hypothetical protein U14_04729 [Candidatus Moduliflexus flocculans]|uniref:Methyl-accepting chemotaxis sensory transducer n=1 Tax=Candidatus Moduliflexus flocculans TaxID=1499966 RepID=A0A0S6W115_9BACT|nr:hypothetical protein U14_04729 [Candidatus Moduliflexus flocculans]
MVALKDVKMKPKLIGLFLAVGLIPILLVGVWSGFQATRALMKASYGQLQAVRGIKKAQIERFFVERQGDMAVLVETVHSLQNAAFAKLSVAQQLKKAHLEEYLTRMQGSLRNLKDDPLVLTALIEFETAFELSGKKVLTPEWNSVLQKYDARFQDILKDNNWYDLFLIHANGNIVYTAKKEADLGTIIPESNLKDASLGKTFELARSMTAEEIAVADFDPYAPSGGQQAAFMIAQIRDEYRQLKGFVAMQMPTDQIVAIVQQRDGLGKTGETYIVGASNDKTVLRSPLTTRSDGALSIGTEVSASYIQDALAGKSGQQVSTDESGKLILVDYAPCHIAGLRWACISKMELEEAIVPQYENGKDFFARYIEKYGYYDLFLIHPDGDVFYSVSHEADYGTNMLKGQYADSNLGKLVKQTVETKLFGMADFAPYAPSNNEPAAFIAQPVIANDQIQLIVGLQLSLEAIDRVMQQREGMGKSGETYLVGADKLMRSDSVLDPEYHSVKASFANPEKGKVETKAVKKALSGESGDAIISDYRGNRVLSGYTPVSIFGTTWALLAEIDNSEVKAPVYMLILTIAIIGVVLGVAVALFARSLAASIAAPLTLGVEFAKSVAAGDLTQNIEVTQQDEIGMLADALNDMVKKLREIVMDVKGAADNVAYGSQQLSSSSEEMSQGATEQAASAEQASSSMEEMTANIRQNAENAGHTERIAIKSAADAGDSGKAVAETVEAMRSISEKILVIDDIARQTNLLSLNATIEASKAGEQGRGFAVVAAEIRSLAERSRGEAADINKVARTSVAIAERAGEMLNKLVPDIQRTAELVQEISAASREQDSGAGQINQAIQQLDQVIQQNASVSEELASTAEELSGQAEQLQMTMSFFKVHHLEQHEKKETDGTTSQRVIHKVAHIKTQPAAASGNNGSGYEERRVDRIAPHVPVPRDEHDDEFERY